MTRALRRAVASLKSGCSVKRSRWRVLESIVLVVAIAWFVLPAVGAATITRVFDITIFPADAIHANFQSSAFNQFDPALGTLNEISTTLSGPATWTSSIAGLNVLVAELLEHSTAFNLGIGQSF